MENWPLVSILMTAFNREKYIAEAVDSVLLSTYTHWELIIVDDVSTDNTVAIAKQYEERDDRIKVYVNENNLGDYPNRNKAASYAKGKYLKYLDADDQLYPHGLRIMVEYIEHFPDAGWGLMSLQQDTDRPFPFMLYPKEIYGRHYFQKSIFHKAPLSSIIKREVFNDVNGFRHVRHYGDYEMWHRLAKYYPLVLMHDGLVWWRGHEGQEADKRKSKPWVAIETINSAIQHIADKDCPLTEDEKKDILKRLKKNQTRQILMRVKEGRIKAAIKMYKLIIKRNVG